MFQGLNFFKYLDINKEYEIDFNPIILELNTKENTEDIIEDTKKIYPDTVEDIPTNSPKYIGGSVDRYVFVGLYHA